MGAERSPEAKENETICLYFRVPFWSFSTAGVVLDSELITQESLWLWTIVSLSLHLSFKRAQGHSDTGHLKTVGLFLIPADS